MATDSTRDVIADLRTGYQVAASLYMQENTLTWARFNAMLTANGILLTAITFALRERFPALLLAVVLPWVGGALCVTWYRMMDRGFDYSDTWRDSALHLEREHFRPHIETLENGELLRQAHGPKAPIRARKMAKYVIFTFSGIYFMVVLIAVGQVINLYA
jgi:hypothetical protein